MNKTIGFIGTGNMARAMIGGLLKNETFREKEIYASDHSQESLDNLRKDWPGISCSHNNLEIVQNSQLIVLAVKPQIYEIVINEIRDLVDQSKTIVTIAAGISIYQAEQMFGKKVRLMRTMPNTPALVGSGVTAYCCNSLLNEKEEKELLPILESFGIVEKVDEDYFHGVIAVSGSSPAYAFMFIEALADGAVLMGISREKAYRMAAQTLKGAAEMVLQSGTHPGVLKDAVCSPGGTTIEAVAKLEKSGFRSSIIEAMRACGEKSKSMTNK